VTVNLHVRQCQLASLDQLADAQHTGRAERQRLGLSSTILLSLFAQHHPQPWERISMSYRWRDLDKGYHRWMLTVNRPETLDCSPLGGEVSDEVPWHKERGVANECLEPANRTLDSIPQPGGHCRHP
jgi:hypothetical protein